MRGSVVKKGGRWYVKIELDPDLGTGKRRQKWHSGYRTRRDAERARIDLLSRFDRGEYVEPSHQTLGEFLNEWLKAIEPTVRLSTFDSYSRNVRNHVTAPSAPCVSPRSTRGCSTASTHFCSRRDGEGPRGRVPATRQRSSSGPASCAPMVARSTPPRPGSVRRSPRPSTSPRTRSPRCCDVASPTRRRRGRGRGSIGEP